MPPRAKAARAPRVLVVYKKSAYQLYVRERGNVRIRRLLATGDATVSRLLRADRHHRESLDRARRVLARLGAKADYRFRSAAGNHANYDLVVTLGGDGTLLWVSHFVEPGMPIVAINTAPMDSVGFLCAGTREQLDDLLADALAGRLAQTVLTRMQVELDDRVLSKRILNDALFCHQSAAATSRYLIRLGRTTEEHKSSGVWVGPAAGSTAAQRSAGGRVLAARSKLLQFVVREPYEPSGRPYALARGLVRPGDKLSIRSTMRAGRLFLDGPHLEHAVPVGSEVSFRRSDEPLTLLGFRRA